MKIFFLDVDGVFTNARIGWYNWDIYAVNFIRWCCMEAGAKIVISSTWRYNNNKLFFENIFGEHLHTDWKTPDFPTKIRTVDHCRGDEIEAWLNGHPEVLQYIILDDDSDMLDHQLEHLIQTCSTDGMLTEHVMKVRDKLGIKSFPKSKQLFQHPNMFEENYWKKYHREENK